ncbi:MAG: DUF3501 family protein [Alphaproteobacteria bacterium]|nr:DUF3501 family protein [Alphaproteobacteria bacterium]
MIDSAPRKTEITRADILPMADYGRERRALRQNIVAAKKPRRVEVGPIATFYFENYQTMWFQVHEMLFVEKGGEGQIDDELRAYNPLIPKGKELVATVMLEIEDPVRRAATLLKLSGIENHMFMSVGGDMIRGVSETEVERTRESDGKTSSVHFVHFPFTDDQILRFRTSGVQVVIGFDHPEYAHMAVLPPAARAALSEDFVL